jgi:hypothetical protein
MVCSERTKNRTPYAVGVMGGRGSAISRRMSEQGSRNGDLGYPEGDITAVADDPRTDLNELLFQGCQRPVFDQLGRCQRS